jgi:hypothetical protein
MAKAASTNAFAVNSSVAAGIYCSAIGGFNYSAGNSSVAMGHSCVANGL